MVDAQGRFIVSDLPPGRYGLCASPSSPEGGAQPRAKALSERAPVVITDIDVQPKQATGIEAKLGRAGTIRGGIRAGDTGRPLGGAGLTVYSVGSRDAEVYVGSTGQHYYKPTTFADAEGWFHVPDLTPDADPHQASQRREMREEVAAAIRRLSPSYRTVIVLRFQHERKLKEVAETLRISPKAAEIRIRRAKAKLRPLLEPLYPGGSATRLLPAARQGGQARPARVR